MREAIVKGAASAIAVDERFGVAQRVGADASGRSETGVSVPASPATLWHRMLLSVLSTALVLSALAYGTVNSWAIGIFQAGAALVLLLWAADALSSGVLRINRSLLQLPLIALAVVGMLQMLPLSTDAGGGAKTFSFDPYQTRLATIRIIALLIYFAAMLAFIDRPERLQRVVRLVIIFGFVLALIGIFQSFISPTTIYGLREIENAFPFGPFVNRHHFANYMLLMLALPLGMLFAGAIERDRQPLFIFAPLVMGIALVMTGSRGAMVSLVVQFAFLVGAAGVAAEGKRGEKSESMAGERRAAWLTRAGGAFALLLLLLIGVLTLGGEAGLSRLLGTLDAKDPTTGRLHLWEVTLNMIAAHPLLGTGLGAYGAAFTRYDTHGGALQVLQAHNDYLQVLADTGIVGAGLGILFLVVLYRMGWRRLRSADKYRRGVALGALTGCTGMFAHSFFEFPLHTTSNALLFLLLAALATLGEQVESQHTQSKRRRRRRSTSRGADSYHAPRGDAEDAEVLEADAPTADVAANPAAR